MEQRLQRFIAFVGCLLWMAPVCADLVVGNLTLVSKQRVGRTVLNYTYQVEITNTGPDDFQNVTATVTSSFPQTTIVDGALTFGDVPAGATVTSSDTIIFRQDRRFPFVEGALSYDIQGTPVSPPAGDTTPPQLSVTTVDGVQVDTASITITGTASDETALAGVTVNGSAAVLSGDAFALSIALGQGSNLVTVVATDGAGNTTSASITVERIPPLPVPQISGISPNSGAPGDLISLSGSNFAARSGAQPLVTLAKQGGGTVSAPVSSFDASTISFTIPASAATGGVNVTVNGQSSASGPTLTVTASSDYTLSASPSAVALIQGATASVDVRVDPVSNFAQTVDLAVSGVPSGVTATLNPQSIAAGQSAVLTLDAPSGQPTGTASLQISASTSVDGIALNKTATVSLDVQPVTTSFTGRTVVADPEQTPLAGVTVTLLGIDDAGNATNCTGQTQSDAAGNFAFTNLPAACVGMQLIRYDGSTVTAPAGEYAGVDLVYEILSGQVVESPVLIHLPRIDNSETVMVIQNHNLDQTFRFSTIPNLSVTVYAGTTLTLKDGSQPDPFPLTAIEVPVDRLPDEMPPDTEVAPFIVAFQPANANADQPIAVTFPNTINTPPTTNVTLMTLDPTQGRMVSYGTGTVSDDGRKIVPDPDPANPGKRFGLVHFDWHGPAGPAPNQNDPCPNGPCGGDPVHFASGLVIEQRTDVAIPAPGGGVSIQRTYRTQTTNAGPFGIGGNHNYSYFLNLSNPSPNSAVINFIVPAGNQFPMVNNGGGVFTNATEPTLRGALLKVNTDGTADVTFKDGTIFHFVPGGFRLGSVLQSITDLNGNTTTLVRNPSNLVQITEIIDSVGRKLKLSYDSGNRITQIADPIGRTVLYSYTTFGRLASVTDAEGGVMQYTYVRPTPSTESNLLASITDARGVLVAQNFYGLYYGPACNGATGLTDDDLAALPQAARDACLNDARTVRDERVWKQIAADGGVMRFRYSLTNEAVALSPVIKTEVTDARGNTTTYRFSPQGQPLDVTDPLGQQLVFEREPGGNQLLAKRGNATCAFCGDVSAGNVSMTRDDSGNVVTQTDALGNETRFTYDPRFNKPTSVTDALSNTSQFSYDAQGNLLTTTDANGNTTRFAYSSRGLPVEVTDALGNKTALTYDAFGNLVKTTDAQGNVTQFRYDAVSRLIETVDPLGRRTKIVYDKLDRIVSQTDAKGQTTTFSYDAVGNLLVVTDAKNHTVAFTYDVMNRVVSRTDAVGATEAFEYDLNGNLVKTTDRRGQVNTFTYDALNRLIQESYADGSIVRNSYDARGRQVRIDDSASGVQTFQYDALGRLTRETAANGSIDYAYDAISRTVSRQVVGQPEVTYSYDKVGNLLAAANPQASVDFTYDTLNRRIQLDRGNGVTTTQSYDALSRILSIEHKNANGVIDRQTYSYDKVGNRKSLQNDLGAPFITQSADAEYDAANRLTRRGDFTYTYDQNGNRLTKTGPEGTTDYTWDSRNRLTRISEPNGTVTDFTYDAFDNLMSQRVAGPAGDNDTDFLVDDLTNVVRQSDSNGNVFDILTGRAIDDHLVVTPSDGKQAYIARDALNSTVATTDASGNPVETFSYEPFGQSSSTTMTTFPIQYTGRLPVSDGLYYYRSRFYDPMVGRFLKEDPARFGAGVNFYVYASGNPLIFRDPLGLFSFGSFGSSVAQGVVGGTITGGIGGAIAGATGGTAVIPGVGTVAGAGALGAVGAVAGAITGGVGAGISNLFDQFSDSDGDGLPNSEDPFPNFPTNKTNDFDGDGIPNNLDSTPGSPDSSNPAAPDSLNSCAMGVPLPSK